MKMIAIGFATLLPVCAFSQSTYKQYRCIIKVSPGYVTFMVRAIIETEARTFGD